MREYGSGRVECCVFCGRVGTRKSKQGAVVCVQHSGMVLKELKCVCGSFLEKRDGKWGMYFHCVTCGNLSMRKALELNAVKKQNPRVEMVVQPDDPRFFG